MHLCGLQGLDQRPHRLGDRPADGAGRERCRGAEGGRVLLLFFVCVCLCLQSVWGWE